MANKLKSIMSEPYQVILYSILALAASAGIAAIASAIDNSNISILTVITPTILAAIFSAIFIGKTGLKQLFIAQLFKPVKLIWLSIALFGIPALAVVSILISQQFGGDGLYLTNSNLMPQLVVILLISIGEEFGWRGYLLPKLQNHYNALIASLILALIWSLWHYPAYLIGVGTPLDVPFYIFMLWVFPVTLIITWVYNNSGSILLPIIMHSAANASFSYLPILPETTGEHTSFYIFIAVVWVAAITMVIIFKPAKFIYTPNV
ncbi:MAG: CPBP family intramembrane metalloprotease [Rhizobiales bacterium]|nr:CPBP family intramembrane metalloprotease [Hyphomicrobiales bacterium]NRB14080.1 CPBP family intramembrane metalloprotease [Hyphomicrobiales bacterium]